MNHPLVSSERRVRTIPGLTHSTVVITSFFFWIGFGLLIGAVELHESKQNLEANASIILLLKIAVRYIPFALVNALLAHLFWRFPDEMLTPKMMRMVPLGLLILGLPFVTLSKTMIIELADTQSISAAIDRWLGYSAINIWIVFCYLLFCYTLQLTYAIWRRSAIKQSEMIIAESERIGLRLYLLQGQLKPHFLFNALNSIGALVRGDDRPLASHALRQLHGLLSYVVEVGKEESSNVGLEMDFVRDYIEMQRLRFAERMAISWDIQDQDWYSIACAPLLFQPLIENVIHHGVEPHHEICQMRISLRLVDDKVHLEISNSMPDISDPIRGFGLGLSATRERLELMYGLIANLNCQRLPLGFVATLCFPAEANKFASVIPRLVQPLHSIQSTVTGHAQ